MPSHSTEDERRLILLAQAGDHESFCALAKEQVTGLLRAAAAFGCERGVAEDLVQETLLEAWRSLGRYDHRCRLATWLVGILRNRWLKSLRRKFPTPIQAELATALMTSQENAPGAELERAEVTEVLRQALAGLPNGQREVLELRFFSQASLEEIAAVLDCPVGTVKSRLHHGLEKLRQLKFD